MKNSKMDILKAALELAIAYREQFLIANIKAEIKKLEKQYRAGVQ